jgi:hypothetical protein
MQNGALEKGGTELPLEFSSAPFSLYRLPQVEFSLFLTLTLA